VLDALERLAAESSRLPDRAQAAAAFARAVAALFGGSRAFTAVSSDGSDRRIVPLRRGGARGFSAAAAAAAAARHRRATAAGGGAVGGSSARPGAAAAATAAAAGGATETLELHNCAEFVALSRAFHRREFEPACAAIARGLATQVGARGTRPRRREEMLNSN